MRHPKIGHLDEDVQRDAEVAQLLHAEQRRQDRLADLGSTL
jgi:hypothetical protein